MYLSCTLRSNRFRIYFEKLFAGENDQDVECRGIDNKQETTAPCSTLKSFSLISIGSDWDPKNCGVTPLAQSSKSDSGFAEGHKSNAPTLILLPRVRSFWSRILLRLCMEGQLVTASRFQVTLLFSPYILNCKRGIFGAK